MTLCRDDFNGLVHIKNTEDEERGWHFLKCGVDTFLLGGFSRLYSELGEFLSQATGVLLVGDFNILHKRWLKFSRGDSKIGADMEMLCDFYGLSQLVHTSSFDSSASQDTAWLVPRRIQALRARIKIFFVAARM